MNLEQQASNEVEQELKTKIENQRTEIHRLTNRIKELNKITHDEINKTIMGLISIIEDDSNEVGWIKCSERMPEKFGCYLIYTRNWVMHIAWYGRCYETKSICFIVASGENIPLKNVTHWMPLPQLPIEVE